jgi:N-acetylglucosaminyldiphosphoundecaprenol N-acetyl-beta-D-mannosaminyltransferase
MDYEIFSGDWEEIKWGNEFTIVINTINAYSYVIASSDQIFKSALQNSDILVPDGFPLVIAARFLEKLKIRKIAGADVFKWLCDKMNQSKGSCFFLGSSESTLKKIKENLSVDFPHIRVGVHSPPFKKEFSDEDNAVILEAINNFSPDVLFVGMTAPKQEKWVAKHRDSINARVITSIGAVFDFYAGTTSRPSEFWINNNLEWFIRLIKEPKRLLKRYLFYSPLFFISMLGYKFRRL